MTAIINYINEQNEQKTVFIEHVHGVIKNSKLLVLSVDDRTMSFDNVTSFAFLERCKQ